MFGLDHQRLLDRLEHRGQLALQRGVQRLGVGQLLARDLLGQTLDDDRGGFNADIGGQQSGFDFFEQVVIDGLLAQKQTGHAFANAGTGLRQPLLEACKEADLTGFRLGYSRPRHCKLLRSRLNRLRHCLRDGGLWLCNRLNQDRLRHRERHDIRHRLRCNGFRLQRLGRNKVMALFRDGRRDMRLALVTQCHRLFGHRQGQPGLRRRRAGLDMALRRRRCCFGSDFGHRLRDNMRLSLRRRCNLIGDRVGLRRG